eukprot:90102_1
MTISCLLVVLLIVVVYSYAPLNDHPRQIDTILRKVLGDAFDQVHFNVKANRNEKALLTSTIRNIFHDCGGADENGQISICDGCIDFSKSDHKGLFERAIFPPDGEDYQGLEDIYNAPVSINKPLNTWDKKMSHADFWAIAATFAVQKAFANAGSAFTLKNIPIYYGRKDCSTSEIIDTLATPHTATPTVTPKQFPSATAGWTDTFNWFHDNFGFNAQEIVAIMGAHTLGFVNEEYSGFSTGPWVGGQLNSALDGSFYKSLILTTPQRVWQQRLAPNGKYEWFEPAQITANDFIMLNVDIGLWKDIENRQSNGVCNVDPSGHVTKSTGVTCTFDEMNKNENGNIDANGQLIDGPAKWVEIYANDVQRWLDDFVDVFIKMITTGYTDANGILLSELQP